MQIRTTIDQLSTSAERLLRKMWASYSILPEWAGTACEHEHEHTPEPAGTREAGSGRDAMAPSK